MTNNLNRTLVTASQDGKTTTLNNSDGVLDAKMSQYLDIDLVAGNDTPTKPQLRQNLVWNILNATAAGRTITPDNTVGSDAIYVGPVWVQMDVTTTETVDFIWGSTTVVLEVGKAYMLYMDGTANGLSVLSSANIQQVSDWKQSVRVASTAAVALATAFENGDTIDAIVLATGDRILIKDQAAGAENGIYTVEATGAPTRAVDADADAEVTSGMAVEVEVGTANAGTVWLLTTANPITVGSTALVFSQLTGGAGGDVVDDLSPQLGANLDVNAKSIVSVSAGDIAITPDTTGDIILDGLKWPQADGTSGQVLETDGAAQLSWGAGGGSGDTYYFGGGEMGDFSPPLVSEFATEVNGTDRSLVNTDNAYGMHMELTDASPASAHGCSMRLKSRPTGDFTFTVRVAGTYRGGNNGHIGICLRESGTSKITLWGIRGISDNRYCSIINYTDENTFSGVDLEGSNANFEINWLRISLVTSTYTFSFSGDGITWYPFDTATKTAFFTTDADQIGFFIVNYNSTGVSLLATYHDDDDNAATPGVVNKANILLVDPEDVAGTTYTAVAADVMKEKRTTDGTGITVTLDTPTSLGLSEGQWIDWVQEGAGQLAFAAGTSAFIRNFDSHTKAAGQWAVVRTRVQSTTEWVLEGRTGA